nr:MAG: RNA-dependent RNA polymerase [Hangzhou sesamia inferens peribunyavirus 1]
MENIKEKWKSRVDQLETPTDAAMAHNALQELRHDTFGKNICSALNIPYRNDITFQEIKGTLQEHGFQNIPDLNIRYTPDNIYIDMDKEIYIIDYKVSANQEYYEATLQKYKDGFRLLQQHVDTNIHIVILALNPYDYTIYCNDDNFVKQIFGIDQPDFANEISWINDLLAEIINTFGSNEDFLNIKNYDSFDYTTPWTADDCTSELHENEHYKIFINALNEKERTCFEEFLNFDLENGTQKDLDNLYYKTINIFKEETKERKNEIVQILNDDKNLTSRTPNLAVINSAWEKLYNVLKTKKTLNNNIEQASPTLHMLWGKDIQLLKSLNINDNFERMCAMATIFKRILITDMDSDNIGPFIKKIGYMLDLSLHKNDYMNAVELQKQHPPNKRRKPIQVANAFVYYDQQFFIPGCIERKKLYTQAHIGTDKKFKLRANEDPILEKPEMLDPFDPEVVDQCIQLIESTKNVLKTQGDTTYKKNAVNEYLPKIKESMAPQTFAKLEELLKSDYYKYLYDSSQLMKGALAMSEVTYHDTFRLIFSASKTSGLILLPSSNIEAARSTICYLTYVVHEDDLTYTGCEHKTYKLDGNLKLTVSKVIRLDKERCKKIVESPNLFIMLSSTLLHNNPSEKIENIANYCFYMSLNITKSVMSLTEPGRYLVMGASSLACNVDEYISDKLDPITKNALSIYLFKKLRMATEIAYSGLRELLAGEILLEAESITKKGPIKDPTINSVWFDEKINLEAYITEIYLPFYINQKGLHYYHHNIVSLTKTPLEIEKKNMTKEKINKNYWRESNKTDQHIDIPVFFTYLSKYHLKHKNKFNQFRSNLENKSNFKKPIYLTRTLTSSKSCIKVGNFEDLKTAKRKSQDEISTQTTKKRIIASTYTAKHRSNMKFVRSNLLETNGYTKVVLINTMGYILDPLVRLLLGEHGLIPQQRQYRVSEAFEIGYCSTQILFITIDDNMPGLSKLDDLHWVIGEYCKNQGPNGIAITDFEFLEPFQDNRNIIHKKIKNHLDTIIADLPYIICSNNQEYPEFQITSATDSNEINTNITLLKHATYDDIKERIPDYVDFITTKVYDESYKKSLKNDDRPLIQVAFDSIHRKSPYYVTLFPKEQRTAVDREIYEGEFDMKLVLYVIERIYKEICRVDADEMISQPGDTKILNIEKNRDNHLYHAIKRGNMTNSCLIEINADMSKFSAQDITYKFLFCIAMNPILYKEEKEHLILFFCKYLGKRLLIPDSVLQKLLDQRGRRNDDIFFEMTDGLKRNWVQIGQNWLQGNLNYIASFVHSVGMMFYNDVLEDYYSRRKIEVSIKPLVHSDDQQTGVLLIADRVILPGSMEGTMESAIYMDEEVEACRLTTIMQLCLLKFGLLLNNKKTYASKYIKEFVSLHNLNGQPFSVYSRFLLPCVGACSFMGFYEDLSARLSGIRTAAQHGSPPGLLWVAVAVSVQCTYETYSMLPGQKNDPMAVFVDVDSRFMLPLELGGYPNFILPTFIILGIEAHDLHNILHIHKCISVENRSGILSEESLETINVNKINKCQMFYLKSIFKFCMLQDLDVNDSVGETFEMRSRSVITPKRFTTARLIKKLESYVDHKDAPISKQRENMLFIKDNPQLLVIKAKNSEEFKNLILFRYYSRTFKESLSLQSPVQLFIEQVLHSLRQCIDREFLSKFSRDNLDVLENQKNQLIGKITVLEAMQRVRDQVADVTLTKDRVKQIIQQKILNDPLLVTLCNAESTISIKESQKRTANFSSQMPQIRTIRTITHTPAAIITEVVRLIKEDKITDTKTDVVKGSGEQTLLQADCQCLIDYLKPLGHLAALVLLLKERNEKYTLPDNSDIRQDLSEICRILQISYQFLSQTGYIKKSILLEKKLFGGIPDFLRVMYGCFLKDNMFYTVDFAENLVCSSIKGYIIKERNKAGSVASRCFKALCYFLDRYINPEHRIKLLTEIINKFSYSGYTMAELYNSIKLTSSINMDFTAMMYHLGDLTDSDVVRQVKLQSKVTTTWLVEQEVRGAMLGEYKVSYSCGMTSITIEGSGRDITGITCYQESEQFKNRDRTIYACLNRFRRDIDIFSIQKFEGNKEGQYVLFRDYKARGKGCQLCIDKYRQNMNASDILGTVQFVPTTSQEQSISYIKDLNDQFKSLRFFYITPQFALTTRRADLIVLSSLSGPELSTSNISLNMLLSNANKLDKGFEQVSEKSVFSYSNLLHCSNPETECVDSNVGLNELAFTFVEEDVDLSINLRSIVKTKNKSDLTIKDNVSNVIEQLFNFYRKLLSNVDSNIKIELNYYNCLITLCKKLGIKSKESELLTKAIHMLSLSSGEHQSYHIFDLPITLCNYLGKLNLSECFKLTTMNPPCNDDFWLKLVNNLKLQIRHGIATQKAMEQEQQAEQSSLYSFMKGLMSWSSQSVQESPMDQDEPQPSTSGGFLGQMMREEADPTVFRFDGDGMDADMSSDDEFDEI